jgi:hypothetical protein
MKTVYFTIIIFLTAVLSHKLQPESNSVANKAIMMSLMSIGFIWPFAFIVYIYRSITKKNRKHSKTKKIVLSILFVITLPMTLLSYTPPEGIFPFNPDIDTKYTPGYSEAKFKQIIAGMTKNDVLSILGEPFSKSKVDWDWANVDNIWLFTSDGACSWSDFAWKRKQVHFKDDIVIETITGWSYD